MSILISILITFVVIILVLYLVNMLPIDGRAKQIVRVVVIIIGIISLLRYLAVFSKSAAGKRRIERLPSSFRPTACSPTPKARCRIRSAMRPISAFSKLHSTVPPSLCTATAFT